MTLALTVFPHPETHSCPGSTTTTPGHPALLDLLLTPTGSQCAPYSLHTLVVSTQSSVPLSTKAVQCRTLMVSLGLTSVHSDALLEKVDP